VSETGYLLGDDDPELRRLQAQHDVWKEETRAGWRRAALTRGDRVLDVGCGPGFTTLELAELVGADGRVLGIDPSDRFTDHLRREAAARRLGNVEVRHCRIDTLDDGEGFDLIHVRWVLCFLAEPGRAIERLAGLLRPGGRLVTLDYFNYRAFALAPRIQAMATVVRAISDAWARTGGSLEVQGRTPGDCVAAGLELDDIAQVSGIARPGEPQFDWPETFLRGFLPRLVDEGALEAATAEAFWSDWKRRTGEPGTFLYLPPLLRVIARKPRPA
jgi:SAM-dependent methyltransferase